MGQSAGLVQQMHIIQIFETKRDATNATFKFW
jgi:hypothetical protein